MDTNANLWCCLSQDITWLDFAHHHLTPKCHLRSVTSVDPTHNQNHTFDTFYGFLADGFEYYDNAYMNIIDADPHWSAHVIKPKYEVIKLTYDVIRLTVRDVLSLCAINIRCRYTKSTFFRSSIARGTRWWGFQVVMFDSFSNISLLSWKNCRLREKLAFDPS